jgi:hypothetical protein
VRGLAPAGACKSNACSGNIEREYEDVPKLGESILRAARAALAFVADAADQMDENAIRRRLVILFGQLL